MAMPDLGHLLSSEMVLQEWHGGGGEGRDALEAKGPQRRPQRRLGGRLEGVAKAVGGGYCRLQLAVEAGTCRPGDSGWA